MCLTANATLVDSVIDELVAKNEPFTAYDVTRAARARGATEYHKDLKGAVHSRWFDLQNNGYTRSLVPTPTGDAWLYHANSYNPQDYINKLGVNAGSNSTLPSPNTAPALTAAVAVASLSAVSSAAPTVATSGTVKNQTVDAEGRLPIYGDQLDELNVVAGDTVNLYSHGSQLTLEVVDPAGKSPIATYSVNADRRIRISGSTLAAYLPNVNKPYKVSYDGSRIVIQA